MFLTAIGMSEKPLGYHIPFSWKMFIFMREQSLLVFCSNNCSGKLWEKITDSGRTNNEMKEDTIQQHEEDSALPKSPFYPYIEGE